MGIVMRTVAIVIAMLADTATAHAAEINAFISTAIKAATDELRCVWVMTTQSGHAV